MDRRHPSEDEIFEQASLLVGEARAAYLREVTGGNEELRQRIEALLQANESAGPEFLNEPPVVSGKTLVITTGMLPVTEKAGDKIGRYKLREQIGEGGCGVVYVAEQEEPVRRRVALKVIKLGMDTKQVVARFEAERQALALMDHPNIAKVLDAGATDTGRPYFVMELVRGIKITDYCDKHNLATEERLRIFIQVCSAIQHAHQKGIIHRDIKPSNVLVTLHDGVPVPKVIDFGIAKATNDQRLTDKTIYTAFEQFIGTPAYMSPEQAEMSGLDIDTRSDIYSLGVLLYELLTGRTPFDSTTLLKAGLDQMRRIIREQEPQRPSTRLSTLEDADLTIVANHRSAEPPKLLNLVRGDLDWIVMKSLEKDRTRRYETVNALAMDAKRHLENEPVLARPPSRLYRLQKLIRRNKLAVGASGAVVASLVLGLALATWHLKEARTARAHEQLLRIQAEAANDEAKASEKKTRTVLAASDFREAAHLIEQKDCQQAIPYLVRTLAEDPSNSPALTRLTTLLTYHSWMPLAFEIKDTNEIMSAQFSPNGMQILTTGRDGIKLWDARNGKELATLKLKPGDSANYFWSSVQFSHDGKRILSTAHEVGDLRDAFVFDAQTAMELSKPISYTNWFFYQGKDPSISMEREMFAFSEDGRLGITTAADGRAQIWNLDDDQPVGPVLRNISGIRPQFSPNGKWVVTKSAANTVQIWEVQTGKALEALEHTAPINSAQFSADGNWILTVTTNSVHVWNAKTGKEMSGIQQQASTFSAELSPDGKQFVVWSGYDAEVWDARTGERSAQLKHTDEVSYAEFSPDGRRILTISEDNTARVWNIATGHELTEPLRYAAWVLSAHFSSDGRRIVTVSSGVARVWDAAQIGGALGVMLPQAAANEVTRFSPDGQRTATVSGNSVMICDAKTGKEIITLSQTDMVDSAQFSPDGKFLLTVATNCMRLWHVETGRPASPPFMHLAATAPAQFSSNTFPVFSANFSPDGERIVTTGADNTARIWEALTGNLVVGPLKHAASTYVNSAQFSPDGQLVITASDDGTARVWDAKTGRQLNSLNPISGSGVASAEFSPDGKWILTISSIISDKVLVHLWDSETFKESTSIKFSGKEYSARFSPDGRLLMAIGLGGSQVWDMFTGKKPIQFLKEEGEFDIINSGAPNQADFSHDGKRIVTRSSVGAHVWDTQTGKPLAEHLGGCYVVTSVQFNQDGTRILAHEDPYYSRPALWSLEISGAIRPIDRVWDIAPSQQKCPDWLLPLAEAICGEVMNEQGLPEPIKRAPAEILNQIRTKLIAEPDDDEWTRWGRWLLANPLTRTISPLSSITVPQYIEDRIKDNNLEPLEEVAPLAFGDEQLSARIETASRRLRALDGAYTMLSNALNFQRRNQNDEAERNCRQALDIERKLLGSDNALVASSLAMMVGVLDAEKKFAEAEPLARESLEMRRKLFGNENQEVVESLTVMVDVLNMEKKFPEAELLAKEALGIQRKFHSNEAQEVASSLAVLADVLLHEQKFVEAESFARECLHIREKIIPDDWLTFNARSLLGGSLLGQKKYAEAESFLKSGYEGIKARQGLAPEVRLKEAGERLVQLHEATGRSAEAAELRKQLPASP